MRRFIVDWVLPIVTGSMLLSLLGAATIRLLQMA